MIRPMAANMGHNPFKLHSEKHAIESKKIDSPKAAAAEVTEFHKVAKTLKDELLNREDDEEEDEPVGLPADHFLKNDADWAK